MNEKVRDFGNHLGFLSTIFLEQYQHEFVDAATILGDFAYKKNVSLIQFILQTWITEDSFERMGNCINVREYAIIPDEINSYVSANQNVFTELENTAENVCKKLILGEDATTEQLNLLDLTITEIHVSPSSARLLFKGVLSSGQKFSFPKEGLDYYGVIAQHAQLVGQIAELGKQRTIDTDNFYNL